MTLLAFAIRFALSTKCVSWRNFQVHVLRCIFTGPLDIKMALPDYKNCIWVKSQSVKSIGYQDGPFDQRLLSVSIALLSSSIGYQDGPFKLKIAFEVTRDCCALDVLWVLCFESRLCFKSFYKFHSFQNQVLPSFTWSPIFLHKSRKRSLTLCVFLRSPQTQHELFRSLDHLFEGLGT